MVELVTSTDFTGQLHHSFKCAFEQPFTVYKMQAFETDVPNFTLVSVFTNCMVISQMQAKAVDQ